jgi:choline dehydrogenase-like flavoprotein
MREVDRRSKIDRRNFLKTAAAVPPAAAVAATTGVSISDAWADTAKALKPETLKTLARVARDVYPHDHLADHDYIIAVTPWDAKAAADANVKALIEGGIALLDENAAAWIVKSVGGSTVHWAGASLRFDDHEFKIKTVYGDIGGANLLDWPITLAEMEPWYAKAEFKMGTTRTNGIPGLPGSNNFKVMEAGARKLGYTQVHTGRMSINSQPRDGRGSCQQIGFCFQGCKMGAKWSTRSPRSPRARRPGSRSPAQEHGGADRA